MTHFSPPTDSQLEYSRSASSGDAGGRGNRIGVNSEVRKSAIARLDAFPAARLFDPPRSPKAKDRGNPPLDRIPLEIRATRLNDESREPATS